VAFTSQQLDALDSAIARGVLEYEYDGKRTRYRSLAEMLEVRGMIAKAIGAIPQQSAFVVTTDKGLGH
jgi:hypothetical protein